MEYPVNLFLTYLQLYVSNILSPQVCFLKLLEPQTHIIDVDFIKSFVVQFGS